MGYFFKWIEVTGVLFTLGIYTLPAQGSGCCTDGFHSLQQLISTTDTGILNYGQLQGLHPALRITCDGNLTEIIYATTVGGSSTGSEYFNVWRKTSRRRNIYNVVFPEISRDSETLFSSIDENIALYSVRVNNFSVRARDFIGFVAIETPTLRFVAHSNGAPGSIYYSVLFMISIDLDTAAYERRYFPLITVVIAPSSVACSSTTQFLPTLSSVACSSNTQFLPTLTTSSLILTPSPVTYTTTSSSRNSKTIYVAVLSSVVGVCLTLTLLSVTVICVAVRNRKNKVHRARQLSELPVLNQEIANNKDKEGSSGGDNSSMEYNPIYGDPSAAGCIQQQHGTTSDENNYHTLQFEQKQESEQEQHAINGMNDYHILQCSDRKPKYDSESEYSTLGNTCDGAGVQKLHGKSAGCDLTTLAIENDKPNARHNNAEQCGAMVLKPNNCYESFKTRDV